MILPVDFCTTYNNLFQRTLLDLKQQKIILHQLISPSNPYRAPCNSANLSTNNTSNSMEEKHNSPLSFKKHETPILPKDNKKSSIIEAYSMSCKNIKIKKIFRFSIYCIIQLKYQKWSLLKKNVKTLVYLVFLDLDDLKFTLKALKETKIKYNFDIKRQIKEVSGDLSGSNVNYFSEKNSEQMPTPNHYFLRKGSFSFGGKN